MFRNQGYRWCLIPLLSSVQMSGPEAIEWPGLDVDLEIKSLQHPELYPLVIKRNAFDYIGGGNQ